MVVLITLACLETRMSPCGTYTTYPRDLIIDSVLCPKGIPMAANQPNRITTLFGLVDNLPINANGTANVTSNDESVKPVVIPFTGLCFGEVPHSANPETVLAPLNDTLIVPL